MTLPEISKELGLENKDTGTAFGSMSREGLLAMDSEKKASLKSSDISDSMKAVRAILDRAVETGDIAEADLSGEEKNVIGGISKKRGASSSPFKVVEREEVVYEVTAAGKDAAKVLVEKGLTGEEIGSLTPELLADGIWKHKSFRSYNVNTPPSRVLPGRHNPY